MFLRRYLHVIAFALMGCFSAMMVVAHAASDMRMSGMNAASISLCADEFAQAGDPAPADCHVDDSSPCIDDLLENVASVFPLSVRTEQAQTPFLVQWRNATITQLSPPPDA